jgi:selenocysteine lyase/cysteine desulfurase
MIDGAHALGALPVDLTSLGADFFAGNCHKHFAGSKGTAFLYVARKWQTVIRPLCASHGTGSGFWSEFIWDGCRDYANLLSLTTTMRWWAALPGGSAGAMQYMSSMRAEAVELLTSNWGTDCFTSDYELLSNMALVLLPSHVQHENDGCFTSTSTHAKSIQDLLHFEHSVECPVKCISGRLYVRITAHIYNVIDDYAKLGEAVKSIGQSEDYSSQVLNYVMS